MWNWLGGAWTYFASARSMDGLTPSQPVAVPEMAVPFALLYNKELFAKAGISSPPTTWTQFVQDAQKITDQKKGIYGVGMDLADSYDPWHILWVLTRQYGGDFVSRNGKKAELDSRPALEAARFWFSWLTRFHIAPPQSVTWKGADMQAAFAAGKLGMLVLQGLTVLPALKGTPVAHAWAFAPMPTVPYGMSHLPPGGVPVQSFVSGQYLGVFKYSPHRDDALAWIRFVTSPPAQLVFWNHYRYMPVRLQTYRRYPSLQTPLVRTFYEAEVHSYPTPKVGAWGQLEVLVAKATAQVAGEIATHTLRRGDIARAFAQANSQLQPLLK